MQANIDSQGKKDDKGARPLPGEAPQFKVISHSTLVYWWPVWLMGFVMAALSYIDGGRLAIIPAGSTVKMVASASGPETFEITAPTQAAEALKEAAAVTGGHDAFPYHISQNKTCGIIYAFLVMMVILATNVTLRGLWSVINILVIAMMVLMLAHFRWLGPISEEINTLPIYASAASYFVPSTVLFVLWALGVFLFDQRRFIIFSPGQLIVHQEIGDMQQVYDTGGVDVVKRRNDFVRHRLLGLGAGDLIITTAEGRHVFELPNVIFADRKARMIAELMKTRPVVDY